MTGRIKMTARLKTQGASHERLIVTLPRSLVANLRRFADAFRGGNKNRFVADALRAHIDALRKARHTTKLREAYASSAARGRMIDAEWRVLDDQAWAVLDQAEAKTLAGKK